MSSYPAAPRGDDADELFGHTIPDPYRRLEDPAAPETVQWSEAQDELFDEHRARWGTRDHVAARLTELLASGTVSAPIWRGERAFHMRRTAEQEHAVLLTTDPDPNTTGAERVLIDPIAIDPSGATTLDAWQPSKDGTLLAYQLSEGGTEESTLRVMDVATGEDVDGPIDRARYSPVAWLPDNSAFYYVRRLPRDQVPADEQQYHRRVYLHRLGSDDDVEIHGAGLDKTNYYGVSVSRDGRWLIVTASQGTAPRDDVWLADLATSDPAAPALDAVMVGVDAQASLRVGRDGRLYVWTDLDAPRGRLAVADPADPAPENWKDLVPQDHEAVLNGYAILDELDEPVLAVSWTRHALAEISTHDLATGERSGGVDLPGLGTIGGLIERPEGGHEMWFAYTDHSTPVQVLRYDARADALETWERSPGTVDVPAVTSQQVMYRSKDGTDVRMVIISPAGSGSPRQPLPTILYGYGGFNIAQTPAYSASILSWVESGGVWAIAGLRGGSEEGEAWHRAGMRENKQNVFDDFHAAAEYLIGQGWASPESLGIMGGSNGGLLVGGALTQRPELFRAVVCSAPLLDMVRYERFGLGATWNDEYGTAAVPEELEWLLGYSPYHHVADRTAYPAVLFTIFDGDTRVDTMHARKMCAALQAATTGGPERPVLLRAEKDVGHGARAVSRTVELAADQLAFFDHHLKG